MGAGAGGSEGDEDEDGDEVEFREQERFIPFCYLNEKKTLE